MKRVLCRFCGTRDHHPSEMHLCKAMAGSSTVERRPVKSQVVGSSPTLPAKSSERIRKREAIKPTLLDGPHAPRDEKPARKRTLPKPVDIADAPTRTYTAEKQHRYRERKKATDPNYLSREATRQRAIRKA